MSKKHDYAASPFDHAQGDIILRSSDNIDFRIFKLFLSLASPFFETLFNGSPLAKNRDKEVKDGLAVIPVTEDSKTLDALLRFCYPCTLAEDPDLEVLRDTTNVLEAARKYSLGAIEKKARWRGLKGNPPVPARGGVGVGCDKVYYEPRLRSTLRHLH